MAVCIKSQSQNGNLVIGTETGRRKGRSRSRTEWGRSVTEHAHALEISVFMKEDLLPVAGEEQMVQELPRLSAG